MRIEEPAASAAKLLSGLCGDRISGVFYREIKYENGMPGYQAPDRHSLDYGVELHLKSGRVVSFIWKWPVSYFLGIIAGTLAAELEGEHALWEVSSISPWAALLNREILAAHLEWFQDEEAEGHFPVTAKLAIEPEASVYITLGVGKEPPDHLAVLFSDERDRHYGRFLEASGALAPSQ